MNVSSFGLSIKRCRILPDNKINKTFSMLWNISICLCSFAFFRCFSDATSMIGNEKCHAFLIRFVSVFYAYYVFKHSIASLSGYKNNKSFQVFKLTASDSISGFAGFCYFFNLSWYCRVLMYAHYIGACLAFSNSVFNPIIYSFMREKIKEQSLLLLNCLFPRKKSTVDRK